MTKQQPGGESLLQGGAHHSHDLYKDMQLMKKRWERTGPVTYQRGQEMVREDHLNAGSPSSAQLGCTKRVRHLPGSGQGDPWPQLQLLVEDYAKLWCGNRMAWGPRCPRRTPPRGKEVGNDLLPGWQSWTLCLGCDRRIALPADEHCRGLSLTPSLAPWTGEKPC